jgi:hypothetical protein
MWLWRCYRLPGPAAFSNNHDRLTSLAITPMLFRSAPVVGTFAFLAKWLKHLPLLDSFQSALSFMGRPP